MTVGSFEMSSFDTVTQGFEVSGATDQRVTTIDATWAQGRSTFGAVTSGFGFRHILSKTDKTPRLVSARLWAPVAPGTLYSDTTVLRSGRSVSLYRSTLSTDEGAVGEVDVVFGTGRESTICSSPPRCPSTDVSMGRSFPINVGLLPKFLQYMDLLWVEGDFPYSGSSQDVLGGFCRHRTEHGGIAGLLALLDCWPPPVLPLASKPVIATTIQLTVHLYDLTVDVSRWFRFRSGSHVSQDGYATVSAHLWDLDGRYVAWMEQLVAVYG